MKKSLIVFAVVAIVMIPLFTIGLSAAPVVRDEGDPIVLSSEDIQLGQLRSPAAGLHYAVFYNYADFPVSVSYYSSGWVSVSIPAQSSVTVEMANGHGTDVHSSSSGVDLGFDFGRPSKSNVTDTTINGIVSSLYIWDHSNPPTLLGSVTSTFGSFFQGIGLFISSLFTGELSGLLIVFAIGIAVSALAFGVKAIKGFTWGS